MFIEGIEKKIKSCKGGMFIKTFESKTPELIRGIQTHPRALDHRSMLKKKLLTKFVDSAILFRPVGRHIERCRKATCLPTHSIEVKTGNW